MKQLVGSSDTEESVTISSDAMVLLFDIEFAIEVQKAIGVLDPICKLVNFCQKKTTSVAEAAEMWLSLAVTDNTSLDNLRFIEKRKSLALNIYSLLANTMHPLFKGRKLSDAQQDSVQEFLISELSGSGLSDFQKFKFGEGIFGALNAKDNLSAINFWKFANRTAPELSQLATKLLLIPASTAQLERVFYNWSYVHNEKRNRLGPICIEGRRKRTLPSR